MLVAIAVLSCLLAAPVQDETDAIFREFFQGDAEEAYRQAVAYVEEHPDAAAGHHVLGRIMFHRNELEGASQHLQRCLELKPEAPWMTAWTHTVLGQTYLALDEPDQARTHLEQAIELNATQNSTRLARQVLASLTGEGAPSGLEGQPLPAFTFHGLAGETLRPEDFKEKPLLLKFGPSW